MFAHRPKVFFRSLFLVFQLGFVSQSIAQATLNNSVQTKNVSSNSKVKKPKRQLNSFIVDGANSIVTLRLSHSLIGRFETQGKNGLSGFIEFQEGKKLFVTQLSFAPDTFESLIGLRDTHIKADYLETSKFPLVFIKDAMTLLQKLDPDMKWESMTGNLVVKDHSEKVEGKSQIYIENELLRGKVEFTSKISLYPIKKPDFKGVGVEDEFWINVELVARPDFGDSDAGPTDL